MSTPALYNIKTVTGLQDCLVLQVIDSLGNVISGNNYVVRGAIALKGETYNLTVTQDAIGDYLLTWENLPAGVWRYDIFVNEEPLLYGNAIVQGRVTPCVTENTQDLGQFLQVQTDQEGVVKITLSDVNSVKWYAEVAKGSADEAKNVLQDTENLSLDIERQIEAGKTEISETTATSISSINTAENSAIANIDTEKENALDDLSQEVVKAQNYATSAQNSATESATSATNAQESEVEAKNAQTATETLADELNELYARAVFADNSGNVDIEGGLTVDGTANLNGGAVVPTIPSSMDNALNLASGIGFVCLHQLFESKAVFTDILTRAGSASITNNKNINIDLGLSLKSYPNYIGRVFFTPLSSTIGIYGDSKGVIIPLIQYLAGGDKSGWIKLSFQNFFNYSTANYGTDFSLENEDSFVVFPYITTSLMFDITYKNSTNSTFFRTRYIKANTEFSSGLEMVEQNAVIPTETNAWGRQIRAYFILSDTKSKKTFIYVLALTTLYKIAEMPYIAFYEQSHYRDIHVSWGGLGEGVYGKVAFTDQTALNQLGGGIAGEFGSPWLDIAKAVSVDAVTEVKEAVEFAPPTQTTEN